jgi:DNA-binding NtrC family response regulator
MKRSIYIIDDQPEVLETAVAIVRAMMPKAVVTGFNDPLRALEAIKANQPEMILSDQLMPGMSGSRLLEEARMASPASLRIIMSGFVPLDRLTEITSAHQYVAKPFDSLQLKKLLERTFAAAGPSYAAGGIERRGWRQRLHRPNGGPGRGLVGQSAATGQFAAFWARVPGGQPGGGRLLPGQQHDRRGGAFAESLQTL